MPPSPWPTIRYPCGSTRSDSFRLPLKLAFTGPIDMLTVARNSSSPAALNDWQPGTQSFSTSGSFRHFHTRLRGALIVCDPLKSISVSSFDASLLRELAHVERHFADVVDRD